jgi:hypothetical protein
MFGVTNYSLIRAYKIQLSTSFNYRSEEIYATWLRIQTRILYEDHVSRPADLLAIRLSRSTARPEGAKAAKSIRNTPVQHISSSIQLSDKQVRTMGLEVGQSPERICLNKRSGGERWQRRRKQQYESIFCRQNPEWFSFPFVGDCRDILREGCKELEVGIICCDFCFRSKFCECYISRSSPVKIWML